LCASIALYSAFPRLPHGLQTGGGVELLADFSTGLQIALSKYGQTSRLTIAYSPLFVENRPPGNFR